MRKVINIGLKHVTLPMKNTLSLPKWTYFQTGRLLVFVTRQYWMLKWDGKYNW